MAEREAVEAVTVDHQMVEEDSTQEETTRTLQPIDALCIEDIPCHLRIEPSYIHLACERLMNIIEHKCTIDYFDCAANTYQHESRSLKVQKFAELTKVLLDNITDLPSSQTWKTGSST
jgi:hypothetical protein